MTRLWHYLTRLVTGRTYVVGVDLGKVGGDYKAMVCGYWNRKGCFVVTSATTWKRENGYADGQVEKGVAN